MQAPDNPTTHYDHITEAWKLLLGEDFHYGYFNSPDESLEVATENLTTLMAEKAELTPGHKVLDVGCGIGTPACFLAACYGCRVTGISTSQVGVRQAMYRVRQRGLSHMIELAVGDGMSSGFLDESFDRTWVLEASHLMPDKAALISECARVLRRGGRLILCDIILHRDLSLNEVLQRAKAFTHLRFAFGRAKMETLATYRHLAEQAGFRVSILDDISEQTFPTFKHWKNRFEAKRHVLAALLGEEDLVHFEASCDILTSFWQEQILGYGLMVAIKD